MSSVYRPSKVLVGETVEGYMIGGNVLFSLSTSISGVNASNALTAYFNRYSGRKIPLWFKDNRYDIPSYSFISSPIQDVCNSVGIPAYAVVAMNLRNESLAAQAIKSYMQEHDDNFGSGIFPYTLCWDINYNYISPTSMSINTVGLILDYDYP